MKRKRFLPHIMEVGLKRGNMEKMREIYSRQQCREKNNCISIKNKCLLFFLILLFFFLFMIFRFECLSNCWMMVVASEYIIPKESNICQFEVNQMNAGSGDWWVYGQDKTNYYFFLGYDSLPYITYSMKDAQKCLGFDKINVRTWCNIIVNELDIP